MGHRQKQDTVAGRSLGRNKKGFGRKWRHSREANGVKMIKFIIYRTESVIEFNNDRSR